MWWARRWYVDYGTYVLCVTMPPPEGAVYSNVTLHKDRGWCFFEVSMASVVKNGNNLWDASKYTDGLDDYFKMKDQLRSGRPKMLSPPAFGEAMRTRVAAGELKFTAKADMETVIEQYRIGFVQSISSFAVEKFISFWKLGWKDEEGEAMLESLEYAEEHCSREEKLEFSAWKGNDFSAAFKEKAEAFNAKSEKFKLNLGS